MEEKEIKKPREEGGIKVADTSPTLGQPSYSFRYNKWKVSWRILHLCLVLIIFYKIVFDWSLKKDIFLFLFSEIVGGMVLVLGIFSLCDVIFTHNITLYQRKIVKTWHIGLRREVEFECSSFGAMKTPFFSTKRFYPHWINNFFAPILGVFYDDTLASAQDVRKMNQLLAEISGRDIKLFDGGGIFSAGSISLKSFLKEGGEQKRE